MNRIYEGIKRWLYGSTSFFCVRKDSTTFNGTSFVAIHEERPIYPTKIVGIKFNTSEGSFGEWRISTAAHGKIFPYDDVNELDSEYRNLTPIDIPAGELYFVEVRSRDATKKGVVIMEELSIIESR